MELQELITRGRFIFNNAPKRLEVYKHVNGRRSAKEISLTVGKSQANTLSDLQKIRDVGLITIKTDSSGKPIKKNESVVYEKIPLAKQIPLSYYEDTTKPVKHKSSAEAIKDKKTTKKISSLTPPSENEILDICREGESQIHEFKTAGTDIGKITKEIAAMLNTRMGGIIFYGVDDDGTISGTDKSNQQIDSPLQNSLKHCIAPAPIIKIQQKEVMGQKILLIIVPSWNKKDVYHYKEKVLIRKGTNVFGVTPEESKKLHRGEYIV